MSAIVVQTIFNIPFKYEQLNEYQAVLSGCLRGIPLAILMHDHDGKTDYSLYAYHDKDHPIAVGETEDRIREIILGILAHAES